MFLNFVTRFKHKADIQTERNIMKYFSKFIFAKRDIFVNVQ